MNRLTQAWIGMILLIGTLVVNSFGAFGVFNGMSQRDISDMNGTLITPAPSTFSIWSVIYALLIAAAVVMIVKNKEAYYGQAIEGISKLFWLTSGLNMLWIVVFSYNLIGVSALVILAFAITLTLLILQLGKIQTASQWLLPAAFGMYTGWLLIATVVNISSWLVSIDWQGFGIAADVWGIIILIVAVVVTAGVTLITKNAILPVPVAWGYFGIYQSLTSSDGFAGAYPAPAMTALVGIGVLVVMTGVQFYLNRWRLMPVVNADAT
ncbi:tryptophan-rich sensory protein [Acetobacterium wieringae]|uniref:Tryptophan-rich sensory protein n=1 Tax=Acetobacterium wieringae TaxID=52694 RepID=A0A5D0WII9_9FIRM|nr:tryptophan-rich sensory protein [Acetobacterium wieringae]MEA4804984.1 tryptophan-rich sensory protein [Acetobacterium wieringae]TYC84060.1 tryptophan-rich sensory protein [Acetobacterium wieringae]